MIAIWNRKELLCTFDTQKQAEVRRLLAEAGIDYKIVVRSRAQQTGRRMGTFGENAAWDREYIIFVKKEDLERALALFH